MNKKMLFKYFIITSSMLSLTLLPAMLPANAVEMTPSAQSSGSYLTNEQFTEYNLWTNYINEYPNDSFGYINRANIQYAAKDFARAIEDYNKAISLDEFNADAYLKRGNCNFVANNRAKALLDYMSAIKIKPDCGEAYFNMGRVYYEQNDIQNAIKNMEKGIAYVNNRADYFYELGKAQYKSGDFQNAYRNFTASLSLAPESADAQYARGLAALNINDFEAAVKSFENALSLKSDYPEAEYYKGIALYQQGNFAEAVNAFDRALTLSPKDGMIYNLRGCAKELSGDKAGAKRDYKQAKELGLAEVGLPEKNKINMVSDNTNQYDGIVLSRDEKVTEPAISQIPVSDYVWSDKPITRKERIILDEAARDRLIHEALKSGDIYGTIAILEQLAEDEPQNPEHYIKLAETKLSIDSYAGVISDAETALRNGSNDPEAYYLEGMAYKNKGNRVYAYRNFAMCYNANKQNPDYVYNLAAAAYDIGRYHETYDLVSGLLDGNLEERFPDARLLKAKAEYKLGKYYSAVDDCNKYMKNYKKTSEAYLYSAFSKEALEQYDDAVKDYTKAIRRDLWNADLHKYRGKLLLSQGHDKRALYDFNQILMIKGDEATSYDHLVVAQLEEEAGNYNNAIACYSKIIQKDDLNDLAYIARADVYNKKGDVYNAIADYSTALRLNPYQDRVYKERGILLVQIKSYRRGIEDLNKALALEPNNGLLYYYRALANKAMGKTNEANADYEKARQYEAL